jgi:predicted glycoside hydrolase/deacetylase ChbG (UPF0249 family)
MGGPCDRRSTAASGRAASCVIVNADDYGYFAGVSRGILDAARDGIVTATGVLATSPHFAEHVPWLAARSDLDAGVHLNLTAGRPLTTLMANALAPWGGAFPGKYAIARAVATGRLPVAVVEAEWRAQIQRCVDAGLRLHFLNSHEHLHILPALARLTRRLAEVFHVPFVRNPRPEWRAGVTPGAIVRNIILHGCGWANGAAQRPVSPTFLGMGRSGRIDLPYLRRMFATLRPGAVYELMCHPGYHDRGEVDDPRLLAYHRWEQELTALSGEPIRDLLRELHVVPIRYQDLLDEAAHRPPGDEQRQELAHG